MEGVRAAGAKARVDAVSTMLEAMGGRLESLHVWKDAIFTAETVSTPKFLGLDGKKGIWNTQFGNVNHAGEGTIVGVLDTGFWPESPSFAPLSEPRPDVAIAARFHGICDQGTDPNPANRITCNNKVIGARFFDAGGLSNAPGANEFHSPRDRNSHGSHTARSVRFSNTSIPDEAHRLGDAPSARQAAPPSGPPSAALIQQRSSPPADSGKTAQISAAVPAGVPQKRTPARAKLLPAIMRKALPGGLTIQRPNFDPL